MLQLGQGRQRAVQRLPTFDGQRVVMIPEVKAAVQAYCEAYLAQEVLPYRPDAWIDHSKIKVGYEIPFNRHFYEYEPPRPLADIEADILELEKDIMAMLKDVTA